MTVPLCPICEKKLTSQGPREWPDWPFCSKRCRMIDLGRWLGGVYRLPGNADPTEDDSASGTSAGEEDED